MKIGILSDIHDNVWNLRRALTAMAGVDAVICCGDLCSPFIIGLLGEGLPERPIHIVFGNNDGDLFRIAQLAAKWPQIHLHGELFNGELGGQRIYVNHYPAIAASVDPRAYDLICYGHNHLFRVARKGQALVINPGPIMGYEPGGKRDVPATFVIYDTATGEPTAYSVSGPAGTPQEHPFTVEND